MKKGTFDHLSYDGGALNGAIAWLKSRAEGFPFEDVGEIGEEDSRRKGAIGRGV